MGNICSREPSQYLSVKNIPKAPTTLKLRHFKFISTIGKGAFTKVILAKRKGTQDHYAIKCYQKPNISSENSLENIKNERSVLLNFISPYVIKLYHIFESQNKICFALEFMQGGNLNFHIEKLGRFSNELTTFYAAEVLIALQELHMGGYIYRDLKADNVLLNREGHIKFADFNLSVSNKSTVMDATGTPEYVAPEIILQEEQGVEVDFWAYGILLYHMTEGKTPFKCPQSSNGTIDNIIECKFYFTKNFSKELKDLITRLLKKYPCERLRDYRSIKEHPYFKGVDWDLVKKFSKASPLNLKFNSEIDLKYFQKRRYSKFVIDEKEEGSFNFELSFNSDVEC